MLRESILTSSILLHLISTAAREDIAKTFKSSIEASAKTFKSSSDVVTSSVWTTTVACASITTSSSVVVGSSVIHSAETLSKTTVACASTSTLERVETEEILLIDKFASDITTTSSIVFVSSIEAGTTLAVALIVTVSSVVALSVDVSVRLEFAFTSTLGVGIEEVRLDNSKLASPTTTGTSTELVITKDGTATETELAPWSEKAAPEKGETLNIRSIVLPYTAMGLL